MKNLNSPFGFLTIRNLFISLSLVFLLATSIFSQIQILSEIGDCEPDPTITKDGNYFGHIILKASSLGTCNDHQSIFWSYKIDLNTDRRGQFNGYDLISDQRTLLQFKAQDTLGLVSNQYADILGHPIDASGFYPYGIHRIIWIIRDSCGYTISSEKLFEVKDCKPPEVFCHPGLVTLPLSPTGCLDINAKDLVFHVQDNSSKIENLIFSFSLGSCDGDLTICCDDFVTSEDPRILNFDFPIWVTDEFNNSSFCRVLFRVTDMFDICCRNGVFGKIVGEIYTLDNQPLSATSILYENNNIIKNNTGPLFLFSNLDKRSSYVVEPFRDDDHINGVTTYDINLIKKYILGLSAFTPYQILASDVNNSKSITLSDVSEIRKLILGIKERFDYQYSFRFISQKHIFLNPKFPYDAPNKIDVAFNPFDYEKYVGPFYGIKMGDINGDFRNKIIIQTAEIRTNADFELEVCPRLEEGKVMYSFISTSQFELQGFQTGFKFDIEELEFLGILPGLVHLENNHIGSSKISNGLIRLSWDDIASIQLHPGDNLFTLVFKMKQNLNSLPILYLENSSMVHEAFDVQGNVASIKLINKVFSGQPPIFSFSPNPVDDRLIIHSDRNIIEYPGLKLFDIHGKEIFNKIIPLDGGKYELELKDLNHSGVLIANLYYQGKNFPFKIFLSGSN